MRRVTGLAGRTISSSVTIHPPSQGKLSALMVSTVIANREIGRSRCFGFVSFSSEDSANTAVSEMDGKVYGWGRGEHGRLGLGDNGRDDSSQPCRPI
ncbi:PREDICTED: glycine-rich RNA-binding protein 4, mitochondrial-like isoform X2 [Camelina sativa]|uniref:Glycine-rich RNA-binding protein 4, mitochondrial-like isoform X1 n=1 Tax=Camelina sativa TaxID=90675 RepID=A0ABM0WFB9_CAMSA|nr:PREDICTED: glycine-rich RNA-binding protein 4, mitochondrial-like isoform X1 [Camelina sativa]XP_010470281.1 PREDICTED: glycine-rich RNA-binding protein 4, mitochondrial-like isoform X2 [Camelina sativa]